MWIWLSHDHFNSTPYALITYLIAVLFIQLFPMLWNVSFFFCGKIECYFVTNLYQAPPPKKKKRKKTLHFPN